MKIAEVYLFQNGMVMTFDTFGNQVPELQGTVTEVAGKVHAAIDLATRLWVADFPNGYREECPRLVWKAIAQATAF